MSLDRRRVVRLAAAVLLLAGGAIHLQLHLDSYATVGIGRTFVANAAASALVAAYLVLRADRLGPLAGIVLSVGSLAGLALTRVGDGLLGFRETGLNPTPQVPLAIAVELAAVVLLGVILATSRTRRAARNDRPTPHRRDRPLRARRVAP